MSPVVLFFVIIGIGALWFALGYLFELTLRQFLPEVANRRPFLRWVECAVVYGPIGIGVLLWEKYESRRWSHH